MKEHDGVTLRSVKWSNLCPWLDILRTFRLAISLRLLVFGASGLLLTLLGWWLLANLFLAENDPLQAGWWTDEYVSETSPWASIDQAVPNRPHLPGQPELPHAAAEMETDGATAVVPAPIPGAARVPFDPRYPATWNPLDPFFGVWAQLTRPGWRLLSEAELAPRGLTCLLLSGLWALAVWGFFGGAISRVAAVQLATDERVGWAAALRYAASKWMSYFAAPLFPITGILFIVLPMAVLGLLMRTGWGLLLAGLIWPLLLVGGFVMTLLLLGVVFGWPLMWATISVEGTDTFDALSRSFAYTFQRPLRYLFCALVAALVGWLGWLLVANFAAAILWLSLWATSWGSGADRWLQIATWNAEGWGGQAGGALIHFWAGCVKWLALGYVYAFFWTAATAIYFQLRRDVDATETDEVFLDADESELNYSLPTVEPAPASTSGDMRPAGSTGANVETVP